MSQQSNEKVSIWAITMDRKSGEATFLRSDNMEATFPLPHNVFSTSSQLAQTTFYPDLSMMITTTIHGDTIYTELPLDEPLIRREGRPVIYLDQKDWSLLANSQHRPKLVITSERDAAQKIINLANSRKIILPVSAGHLSETLKWTDDTARHKLGLTIAQLSGGWQMRDPLDVRRFELKRAYAHRFHLGPIQPSEVITLEPFAIHGSTRGEALHTPVYDLPDEVRQAADALTSSSLYLDMLLNVESIPSGSSPGWVEKNQGFTDWLAGETRTTAQKRQSIKVFFLMDIGKEAAEEAYASGTTVEEFEQWMRNHWEEDLTGMPALELFCEVLIGLHLNQTRKWTNNDLTDLMYLTCAAAYSDYVVTEKLMASQIAQAQRRLNRPVNVFRSFSDFLGKVEVLGGDPL